MAKRKAAQWSFWWLELGDELPSIGSGLRRVQAKIGTKWVRVRTPSLHYKQKTTLKVWNMLRRVQETPGMTSTQIVEALRVRKATHVQSDPLHSATSVRKRGKSSSALSGCNVVGAPRQPSMVLKGVRHETKRRGNKARKATVSRART